MVFKGSSFAPPAVNGFHWSLQCIGCWSWELGLLVGICSRPSWYCWVRGDGVGQAVKTQFCDRICSLGNESPANPENPPGCPGWVEGGGLGVSVVVESDSSQRVEAAVGALAEEEVEDDEGVEGVVVVVGAWQILYPRSADELAELDIELVVEPSSCSGSLPQFC